MLSKAFGINKGDIVSIVGSSGKTSFMLALAEELRNNTVLVTTTTKIYRPKPSSYDRLIIGGGVTAENGVTVAVERETSEGKLSGFSPDKLGGIVRLFEYSLIESDGAKEKPLKAWNSSEPVVIPETTITVGIISLGLVGSEINRTNVHRPEIFMENFMDADSVLSLEHIKKIILHKEGLFKNSRGKRLLFINMVESDTERENVNRLAELLAQENSLLSGIVYGSIKNGQFCRIT